jgi:response regulator of citrate/malate metabolism
LVLKRENGTPRILLASNSSKIVSMDFLKDKKILIVDDDNTTRSLHIKLIQNLGAIEIHEASSAKEAETLIVNENHTKPFDLIICDYIMPNSTGLDLYKVLILNNIHIPFAMVTANSEPAAVKEMINLGITAILVKPLTIEMIITRIAKIL